MNQSKDLYPKVSSYLNKTYLEKTLQNRLKNIEDENYSMDASDLKKITDIDEYFYLYMQERNYISSDLILKIYLNEISKQLNNRPLLLLELPMYRLDKNKLRQYLPNYDYVINKIKTKENEVNNIYRKLIHTPYRVSYQELNKLVEFLSASIPYASTYMYKAQEQVAKYLLNLEKDTPYNYTFTLFLIKFFGYKKLREDNIKDTKIIIGNLGTSIYGESATNFITINKSLLQKVTMERNQLDDKYGKTTKLEQRNSFTVRVEKVELLKILHTVYHEIRHQNQEKHSASSKKDDSSYYHSAWAIINETNGFDYEKNYKCYEIEKDANYKAWEEIEKLIKTYMPNINLEQMMKNILRYKLQEELEQITGIRTKYDNKKYISSALLIEYLDEKIRNNKNIPRYKYKQFSTFYDDYGTPKRTIELLKLPEIYDFKDFYFIQVNYRSKIASTKINGNDIYRLSPNEQLTIINNIKILMNITREKMNKIRDRIEGYQDSNIEVVANLQNYYNFAIQLQNIISKILIWSPNIINDLSIRNAISSINADIDMINNNSLVIKKVSGTNKISKVGRR